MKTDKSCADSDFTLWLWLNGNRPTAVRLGNLNAGDSFTISGLPEGTHVLGAHGLRTNGHGEGRRPRDQERDVRLPGRADRHPDRHAVGAADPDRHHDAGPERVADAHRDAPEPAGRTRTHAGEPREQPVGRGVRVGAAGDDVGRQLVQAVLAAPAAQVTDPLPQRREGDALHLVGRAVQPPLVQGPRLLEPAAVLVQRVDELVQPLAAGGHRLDDRRPPARPERAAPPA